MKAIHIYILTALLVLAQLTTSAFAQQQIKKSKQTETVEGKKFYIHTIEKGQTLYSISKVYETTVNIIVSNNPEVIDGLKIGSKIKIPFINTVAVTTFPATKENTPPKSNTEIKPQTNTAVTVPTSTTTTTTTTATAGQEVKTSKQIETINGQKFYLHTVEKGQTLYSISKAYKTTDKIISQYNSEIAEGLKLGSTLKIPYLTDVTTTPVEDKKSKRKKDKKKETDTPILVKDTVAKTLAITDTVKPIGDIHVGLFLPLALSSAENLDLTNEKINDETKIGIEFYEGFKMAVDSLRRGGFKGHIHIYDSDIDSLTLENLLKKTEVKELDLIIGPLYGRRFDRIQKYAKENKINVVSPTIQANHILMGNSHVSKVTPSYASQAEILAQYVAEKYSGNNIIVFNSANAKDKPYISSFKKTANEILAKAGTDTVKEVTFSTLDTFMVRTKANVIAIPSTNQSVITEVINKLFLHKQESMQLTLPDSILVFGFSNWQEIESLDFGYLKTLNSTITSYSFIDYSNPATKKFILNYRNTYKTEPTEYVYLGFDVANYYLDGLQKYGNALQRKLPELPYKGIQNEFNFKQSDVSSGYENRAVGIIKFENYTYIRVK